MFQRKSCLWLIGTVLLLDACLPFPARIAEPLTTTVVDADTGEPIQGAQILRIVCDIHDRGCNHGFSDCEQSGNAGEVDFDGKRKWKLLIFAPGGLPVPNHRIAVWKHGYRAVVYSQYGDFDDLLSENVTRSDLLDAVRAVPQDRQLPTEDARRMFNGGTVKLTRALPPNDLETAPYPACPTSSPSPGDPYDSGRVAVALVLVLWLGLSTFAPLTIVDRLRGFGLLPDSTDRALRAIIVLVALPFLFVSVFGLAAELNRALKTTYPDDGLGGVFAFFLVLLVWPMALWRMHNWARVFTLTVLGSLLAIIGILAGTHLFALLRPVSPEWSRIVDVLTCGLMAAAVAAIMVALDRRKSEFKRLLSGK